MSSPIESRPKAGDPSNPPRRDTRFATVAFVLSTVIALWLLQRAGNVVSSSEIPYSEFREKTKAGQVVEVTFSGSRVAGTMKDPSGSSNAKGVVRFQTVSPPAGDPKILDDLDAAHVRYSISPASSPLLQVLLSWLLPIGLLGMFWF